MSIQFGCSPSAASDLLLKRATTPKVASGHGVAAIAKVIAQYQESGPLVSKNSISVSPVYRLHPRKNARAFAPMESRKNDVDQSALIQ